MTPRSRRFGPRWSRVRAHGFEADPWTLERVGVVVERVTGGVAVAGVGVASADRPAGGVCSGPGGGRWSGTSPRSPAGSRTGGHASKKGTVNTRAWSCSSTNQASFSCPQVRRTYTPRGRTPLLRHRLNRKRASMAAALGYHSTDPDRDPRLCFHLKPGAYDTTALIEVLEAVKAFYRGDRVILVRSGLSARWSRAMRAWVAQQDRLAIERLPDCAPELNPVELLWSSLKKRELANLADATEQGIHRINHNQQLPWSFLAHTDLTIHPPHPPNLRKDQ
ncbi:transposase [Streptomyces sp. TG1A-8]|nr:transposase [Streptomyces sp. TG1A-8]MDO0929556.1 transposase [Streptomyces sp. TG1A-8]